MMRTQSVRWDAYADKARARQKRSLSNVATSPVQTLKTREYGRLAESGDVVHAGVGARALLTQMCQTAACNRHHSIEQQLCRWLLLTLDRLPSNELIMTQELVASMLGVRREAITEAAGKLQRAGFIRYRRGHISVL